MTTTDLTKANETPETGTPTAHAVVNEMRVEKESQQLVRTDLARWTELVQRARITPD